MQFESGHGIFHLMRKLIQEHTANWQSEVSGLTKPQYSVMLAVSLNPGVEQGELMEASVSTKATLAEIVGRLEKRGLIYRQTGEKDKRRRFVYLTQDGLKLLEQEKAKANYVDNIFLSRLSKQEQSEFIRLLNVIVTKP
ncbi:MarR family winged helix-turn-helix transcriptional regulator [Vibrio salinus]|uniref:MarR family winged helix-turn-helix transcriptional regulator n=1 Tax=Vibrio salinus TaxID=2899784 RepID=UPI001E601288|nr:MarR family transcriptional regulator [Vibrio salinus]MCE0494694.1 MarR family transcriptional regulator [Vibrio salinus]